MTVDQGGVKSEVTTDLSNYQTVDGLTMPFTMKQSVNGAPVAEVTIAKWEVNVPDRRRRCSGCRSRSSGGANPGEERVAREGADEDVGTLGRRAGAGDVDGARDPGSSGAAARPAPDPTRPAWTAR